MADTDICLIFSKTLSIVIPVIFTYISTKKYQQQKKEWLAKEEYLSLLGYYCTAKMNLSKNELLTIKKVIAKRYNLSPQIFPIGLDAWNQMYYKFVAKSSISINEFQQLNKFYNENLSSFLANDSLPPNITKHFWERTLSEACWYFLFATICFFISMVFTDSTLSLTIIFLSLLIMVILSFVISIIMEILFILYNMIHRKKLHN